MANEFASGKHAWAICDRCGFRYKYSRLKPETYLGKKTGIRVCPKCLDPEHPQDRLPEALARMGADAIGLRDPRPEEKASRELDGDQNWYERMVQREGGFSF